MQGTLVKIAIGLVLAAILGVKALGQLPVKAMPGKLPAAAAAQAARVGASEHRIAADGGGQYHTFMDVNGVRVDALVDTGATFLVMSAEDAAKARVATSPADFTRTVSTANGVARVAHVWLQEVRVGALTLQNVEALVAGPGAMSTSLLGMSFLGRLSKMEASAGSLLLRQ